MAGKPRIGIIGNGNVGKSLMKGLLRSGYSVEAVGRDPPRVKEIAKKADVVVLAVPFNERENALREAGDAVNGKTLIDVTNALTASGDYAADTRKSGAEQLQEKARQAKVVKAFNTVFAQNMSTGKASGESLTLFVAGDDANAKEQVLAIGRDLGFEPVDSGPLTNSRWLETLGILNIQLGYNQKLGTDIGFRLAGNPQARSPPAAGIVGRAR